jgi:type VI secretion system protein VasD
MNRQNEPHASTWTRWVIALALLALLSACAGAPKKETLTLAISATEDVNPDLQGRASPIVLHILTLKSAEQFNALDYQSLASASSGALGADQLARDQVVLSPGSSRSMELELDAGTQAIGLVAGYRDLNNSSWRQAVTISPGSTKSITVNLTKSMLETSTN